MINEPIIVEQTYNAPADRVWKAITDKSDMAKWYFQIDEFKPVVGFEFQFYGESPTKRYLHLCKVTEVVEGKKLSYTWQYEGQDNVSHVTFELFPENNKTKVRLTHAGVEGFVSDEPDFGRASFVQGWTEIIGTSLKQFVESSDKA
jgi:uncharacterized protein YndB with AHSA1/START domain